MFRSLCRGVERALPAFTVPAVVGRAAVLSRPAVTGAQMVQGRSVCCTPAPSTLEREQTRGESMITGLAHLVINVNDWNGTMPFYRCLLTHLGLTIVADTDNGVGDYDTTPFLYYVGGKTAIGFHEADDSFKGQGFDQRRVGLHHWCLRARNREAVDSLQQLFDAELVHLGGTMVREASESHWAPGYYSILFEDPEGMRVELNHVPGAGLLAMDTPSVGNADGAF